MENGDSVGGDTGGRELSETISAESASGMVNKLKTQE